MNVDPIRSRQPGATLVITTLAEYQTAFWAPVCKALMAAGADVFVLAFDDRSADMLAAQRIPVARMSLSMKGNEADNEAAFEARLAAYGIAKPNLFFGHERIAFRIRDGARLRRTFLHCADAVEAALDRLERSGKRAVMLQELGAFISVIASYFGARRRGIDNWFVEPAFFRGRLFFLKNTFAALDIPGPVATAVSPEVAAYVSDTLSRRAIVIPQKDRHQYAAVVSKVFNARNAQRLLEKLYDKHVLGKHQTFGHIGAHVHAHLEMVANAYRTRALYRPLGELKRFIYYPLHVPADMGLTIRSPEYFDQLALVEYLLRIVPASHRLAIKEHPAQIGALSARRLQSLAKRYDNLLILDPKTNNYAVLERCDAVVSINSKSGAEALLMGRPVLVLGDAFYANCPFVTRVHALADLPALLVRALGAPPPAADEALGYFQTVYERSLPGELYVADPKNVATFASSVLTALDMQDAL